MTIECPICGVTLHLPIEVTVAGDTAEVFAVTLRVADQEYLALHARLYHRPAEPLPSAA